MPSAGTVEKTSVEVTSLFAAALVGMFEKTSLVLVKSLSVQILPFSLPQDLVLFQISHHICFPG